MIRFLWTILCSIVILAAYVAGVLACSGYTVEASICIFITSIVNGFVWNAAINLTRGKL